MNALMIKLLADNGYWDEAGSDGAAGGGSGDNGNPSDDNGGEGDSNEGEGEKGGSESGDEGESDKPSDKEAKLIKDVMKWKDKARASSAKIEELTGDVNAIKSALGDLSLDDVKAMILDRKTAETKALEDKGEYKRIVEQMKEENNKIVEQMKEELATERAALVASQKQIEELTIGRAFSDSEFIRESSTLPSSIARKEFGDYFDTENGMVVAYDKPRGVDGRTKLVDSQGEPKSFNEAIGHLYATHSDSKSLIKSRRKPGAGSSTEQGSGLKTNESLHGVSRIQGALGKK